MRTMTIPLLFVLSFAAACDDDEVENTGSSCAVAEDCYPDLDRTAIQGEIECLTRIEGGYCTHLCSSDTDCCTVEGECRTGYPQVCSPFENSEVTRCFLSCEPTVIGDMNETEYCQANANEAFICRSSGSADHRRICVPPG